MDVDAQRSAVCCELIHSVACSFGEVRLKVTGSSMLPVIWPGDEITVVRSEHAELQPGQVILYRRNGRLTAHRIEEIAQDHLITRGDSLPTPDAPVQIDEIVGQVVNILRNGQEIRLEHSTVSQILSVILQRSHLSRRFAQYLVRRLTAVIASFYNVPGICR